MKKTVFCVLLLLLLCFCMAACGKCGKDDGGDDTPHTSYEVWSTYNTIKVIAQTYKNSTYPKLSPALSVEMMRGEYEGAQLLVTAGKDDTTAELIKGPLRDESGRTIPDGQVQVYLQMYTQIQRNYNGGTAFAAGDKIPDMLLPMEDLRRNYRPGGDQPRLYGRDLLGRGRPRHLHRHLPSARRRP